MPRMPADSFEKFVELGDTRSYAKLAAALGVSKRSVTARAAREGWQQRLAAIEGQARAKADQKLAETTAAINDRHLRTLRTIQHKALQALTSAPTGTAAQAAATLIAAVRAERNIVAPPGTEATRGPSHAETCEMASRIPKELVDKLLAAERAVEEIKAAAMASMATPPPEPIVPPGLLSRVPGEN